MSSHQKNVTLFLKEEKHSCEQEAQLTPSCLPHDLLEATTEEQDAIQRGTTTKRSIKVERPRSEATPPSCAVASVWCLT